MAWSLTQYDPSNYQTVQAAVMLEKFDTNTVISTAAAYKKKYKNLYDNNYTAILPGLNSMSGELTNALTAANAAADLSNAVNNTVTTISNQITDINKRMDDLAETTDIFELTQDNINEFTLSKPLMTLISFKINGLEYFEPDFEYDSEKQAIIWKANYNEDTDEGLDLLKDDRINIVYK